MASQFRNKFLKTVFLAKKIVLLFLNSFSKQKYISKKRFIDLAKKDASILEIGPFTVPCITGNNVDYFDVLNKEKLIERAILHQYPYENCPEIKYVSPTGDLSIIDKKYDYVISSHCVEHQPDLIQHFKNVEGLLNNNGKYFVIIPDKRFCFDALLNESTIQEVYLAHHEQRKLHTLKSIIEHRSLITHNKAWLHWIGVHGKPTHIVENINSAYEEYRQSDGGYIDVHAWQFTPSSFLYIMKLLNQLNLTNLETETVFTTKPGELEFYAILKKRSSKI